MKPIKNFAKIEQPIPGTALYRTDGGGCIFVVHYSSDPAKDSTWVQMNSSLPGVGGVSSARWQQEMELDDQIENGERTYPAFDRSRNVIQPRAIEPHWPITLGFDFGQTNPTAVIFIAQDPLTRECYVFDSVYRTKGIDPMVTQEIYEKIAKHRGTTAKEMRTVGIDRFIGAAIGDPSGPSYAAYYAQCSYPISIATKLDGMKLNDVEAGESHVNAGLTPRIICCGAAQYNPNPGEEAEKFRCGMCGTERVPTPSIFVMDGRAEELCDQWEMMVKKPAPTHEVYEDMKAPEANLALPDHAADAARYAFRVISFEPDDMAPVTAREGRLDMLKERMERFNLEPHEEIELMVLERHVELERQREADEMGYTRGMFITDHHQHQGKAKYGYGLLID